MREILTMPYITGLFSIFLLATIFYAMDKEFTTNNKEEKETIRTKAESFIFGETMQISKRKSSITLYESIVVLYITVVTYMSLKPYAGKAMSDKLKQLSGEDFTSIPLSSYISLAALVVVITIAYKRINIPLYQSSKLESLRMCYIAAWKLLFFILVFDISGYFVDDLLKATFFVTIKILLYLEYGIFLFVLYKLINTFFDSEDTENGYNTLFFWLKESIKASYEEKIEIKNEKHALAYYVKSLNNTAKNLDFDLNSIEINIIRQDEINTFCSVKYAIKRRSYTIICIYIIMVWIIITLVSLFFYRTQLSFSNILPLIVYLAIGFFLVTIGKRVFVRLHYGNELLCLISGEKAYITGGELRKYFNSSLDSYCSITFNMISLYIIEQHLNNIDMRNDEAKFERIELWNKYINLISDDNLKLLITRIFEELLHCGQRDIENTNIDVLASRTLDLYYNKLEDCNISKEEIFQ